MSISSQDLLKVQNLTKIIDNKILVDDVTFSISTGEVVGILGKNGAGKTTLLYMLTNLMQPTDGSIYYFGKNFAAASQEILQDVGFATTYASMIGTLSVYDNLWFYGTLYGVAKDELATRITLLAKELRCRHILAQKFNTLSAGQRTCVMLAKAFIANPKLVILDEPTAALDPITGKTVRSFIAEHQRRGTTFLITSHNMEEITSICNRVLVIDKGKIIANSTPKELVGSIGQARIKVYGIENTPVLAAMLAEYGYHHAMEKEYITITLPEEMIAEFFSRMSERALRYTRISIETPTLDDYFMSLHTAHGTED